MGWDAHSSAKVKLDSNNHVIITDDNTRRLFKNASNYVIRKTKYVDGLLEKGSLDCSRCAEMLEEATGRECWDYNDWTNVKEIAKRANWDFDYTEEDAWAYWSARKFLEVCAKANLSISFSW